MSHFITDFAKAIELKPDFGDAYHSRGIAFVRINNPVRAQEDFKKAASLGVK